MSWSYLSEGHWNPLDEPRFGFMNVLSESIKQMEAKYPDLLPDIRSGSIIFVGSDYGGQHDFAQYQSLSFLFADLERCAIWERRRRQIRQHMLRDRRRMSYKRLGDRRRKRAVLQWLEAANSIPGLLTTILVEKRIESLFSQEGKLQMRDPKFKDYANWNAAAFEKLLRVVHFVGFFIAGLSAPNQDVLWITDEDDIVANEDRLREVVKLFANVSSHYLTHDLRHVRIGTTKSDSGTRDLEDLVSIPDFAAGALSELLTEYSRIGIIPKSEVGFPPPKDLSKKARVVMNWFADHTQPLKRMVYLVEEEKESKRLSVKYLRLQGSRDFLA